jgi:MarR family transcriptional regulator, 2-MHQ and catechol-resistance regulon repressor
MIRQGFWYAGAVTTTEQFEQAGLDPADGNDAPAICEWVARFGDERITLMGLLVEAHTKLTRALNTELEAACGLPLGWFDVMIRLGRSPNGRLTMTQLASEVALTSGGVTRLIDRMVEAGLVERTDCPSDRRSVHVVLTLAGTEKLHEATVEHLAGLERHLLEPLDSAEQASLASALRKLVGDGPVCGG